MWYPQYAGGKFIMNCLSLSQHCVPMDIESCEYLLKHPVDYAYRLSSIMKTLPHKNNMSQWFDYEFNNQDFYDDASFLFKSEFFVFDRMQKGIVYNYGIDNRISNLIDKNMDFFAETRSNNFEHISQYVSLWPNSKIILLTNCQKFQEIASFKKNKSQKKYSAANYCGNECEEKYNALKGNSWPSWELFQQNYYNIDRIAKHITIDQDIITEIKQFYPWYNISNPIFNLDVDNTFFDKDNFFICIKKLYNWLGYDDFNEDLLLQYYTAYINLHKN